MTDLPKKVPREIVKALLDFSNQALASKDHALASKDQALASKDRAVALATKVHERELAKVRSSVEVLQLRAIVEEVAAKIRLEAGKPLSVQDALKAALVKPEFVACMKSASRTKHGIELSTSDIQTRVQTLCHVLSVPAHQYLSEFDTANPGLTRHEAVRNYLPTILCLATTYEVRVPELGLAAPADEVTSTQDVM
jgi:hypothetical protein